MVDPTRLDGPTAADSPPPAREPVAGGDTLATRGDPAPPAGPDPDRTAVPGGVQPGAARPASAVTWLTFGGAASGAAPRVPQAGEAFGPYDLQAELGRGGMGAVFRARERATGRELAVKVMLAAGKGSQRERFQREGVVAASLDHPGIVRIHAAGEVDGLPFLACELVPGARDLASACRDLAPLERVRLVRDAARALGYAHARDVVHRDVKPDNLLVDGEGRVRVADFGIAAMRGLERLTQTGALLGTPAYMAPEQIDGARGAVGPWTDVWALGVVLHEVLAGRRPFEAGSLQALHAQVFFEAAPPPGASPALDAICAHALGKTPAERYPDATALADDLDRALAGESTAAAAGQGATRRRALARRAAVVVVVAALAAGLAAAAGRAWRSPTLDDARGAPHLDLTAPASGSETTAAFVRVRGRARDDGAWVDVSVNGAASRRVAPGAEFDIAVPLAPGENRLVVDAVDAGGARAPSVTLVVRRAAASPVGPAWLEQLPAERRPPLPLPAGLSFGAAAGEYVNDRDGSLLVYVPPGTFTQGQRGGAERLTFTIARPELVEEIQGGVASRRVRLTRGYFLGKLEVTFGQYARFCAATGATVPDRALRARIQPSFGAFDILEGGVGNAFTATDAHPVWRVSLADAEAYCAWAGLRVPTEAEWEWAARGPDERDYPWGAAPPSRERLNRNGDDDHEFTAPVGSFPAGASPFGCLDMAGNVEEWLVDWIGPYPASSEVTVDPAGPTADGRFRATRGGNWTLSFPDTFSATFRSGERPHVADVYFGFRVCRSAE
jgi:serine/threonine-protein kinase